ncbi:DUF2977 domain-containing protein [Mammaliicoccus sp. A-M4]|uniref:DUF2977 domain-containing protein n=1 Tax=Mammaliicoccus sp. A-M4 TaxID=2898664 RepID=UPI001EFB8AA3|nr:DUF2977 domain-containing protein [Mammaliicoccus sp. A-M4]
MQIIINENNEITSYAVIGNMKDGIEVNDYPSAFTIEFKPRLYLYVDGQITLNENYTNDIQPPIVDTTHTAPGSDEELRKIFGSLQMSSVQTMKMVMDLSKQVASLTKQNVELQKQLNEKGVE